MKRPPKPPSTWGSTEEYNANLAKYQAKMAKFNKAKQDRIEEENKELRFREKVRAYGGDPDAADKS